MVLGTKKRTNKRRGKRDLKGTPQKWGNLEKKNKKIMVFEKQWFWAQKKDQKRRGKRDLKGTPPRNGVI